MVVSWLVGQAVGAVAQRIIDMQIDDYKKKHPLPRLSQFDVAGGDEAEGSEESQPLEVDVDDAVVQPSPKA